MSAIEILPCPCCGSAAGHQQISHDEPDNGGGEYIECSNPMCGITTRLMWSSMDAAGPLLAEVWNERSELQGLVGLIDLVLGRDDLTPALREVLDGNHRIVSARAAILKP